MITHVIGVAIFAAMNVAGVWEMCRIVAEWKALDRREFELAEWVK